MTECPHFEHLLVIPRLRIQNANAISSPLTHGFPSITAFMGLMWALERQTRAVGLDLQFNAVGVVAHDFDEQTTDSGFVRTFRLTRNPIDRDGKTAAIVEEGRIHLDISLVFAVQSQALNDVARAEEIAQQIRHLIAGMRVASGTVVASTASTARQRPYVIAQTGDENSRDQLFQQHKMRLLPGFVLVERQDLLEQRYQALREKDPSVSRLDAWLSLSRVNYSWQSDAEEGKGQWEHDKKGRGWLVPIPVGYGALTDLQPAGSVANARDATTPFRFVESLYGIGQWLSPHRLRSPQQMLWYADSQPETGLYRCRNDYTTTVQPEYEFNFE
jgi:CRISPR-associated protein Csy2